MFKDHLKLVCSLNGGDRYFRERSVTTERITEYLWYLARPSLPKNGRDFPTTEDNIIVLGDKPVSAKHQKLLQLGPKFGFKPVLHAAEKLAFSKSVCSCVPSDFRPRCVNECVSVLRRTEDRQRRHGSTHQVVEYLLKNDPRLLVVDKDGVFIVMPASTFWEKAIAAVEKNFKKVQFRATAVRNQAVLVLQSQDLLRLASSVTHLEVFFSVKTHKTDMSFRCIVSRRAHGRMSSQGICKAI